MPSIIDATQALRLLRQRWPNASMLAEELYAILTAVQSAGLTNPLAITKDGSQPAIQLKGYQIGDTIFTVTGDKGNPLGDIVLTGGGLQFVKPGDKPTTGGGTTVATGGGSVWPGKIISGSGDTYEVDVYITGRSRPPARKTVKQVQIDLAEKIPAGTWAFVILEPDGVYTMQVPVWL